MLDIICSVADLFVVLDVNPPVKQAENLKAVNVEALMIGFSKYPRTIPSMNIWRPLPILGVVGLVGAVGWVILSYVL
jgi:hypothetical protein